MGDEEFNLGQVFETVAATIPEREAIVWGDRRLTYADLRDRSRRLATFLHRHGLGAHRGATAWPGTSRPRTTSGSTSTTATSTSRG